MILIPDCMICNKETTSIRRIMSGGVVLDVCKHCAKYGQELDEAKADEIVFKNSKLVKHVKIC
ncbi:MAG TPA: hypothetical protein ENG34_00825 [Candidatus Aenigmarchaeota archaeon]|nr:hypothetical protein [Candidatus Aenigmarchaeota archaeon]